MRRIDFEGLSASLDPERVLPEWLPDGKRVGGEWVARNPTRDDRKAGSFSINLRSGAWGDFATGDEGGDVVSLWAYLNHGSDNAAAARDLADRYGLQHLVDGPPSPASQPDAQRARPQPAPEPARKKPEPPKIILPVPADAPDPTFRHPTHGRTDRIWTYRNRDGEVLLYVCRFDHDDGSKDIVPRSWCEHPEDDNRQRWTWRGVTGSDPRPLYGLDRLAARPDADVVIVEGEKAADAGQELLGDEFVVLAWLGGTSCADRVDLKPLRGRRVILWPDADSKVYPDKHERAGELRDLSDQPGVKAMIEIAMGLADVASIVRMVGGYTPGDGKFADGWDLADALGDGWQTRNALQFLDTHVGEWREVVSGRLDPEPEDDSAEPMGPDYEPEHPDADFDRDEQEREEGEPAGELIEGGKGNIRAVSMSQDLNPWSLPHVTEKGVPQNTIENVESLLSQYGIRVAFNVISKEVEIDIPGVSFGMENEASNSLAVITSLCARNRIPKGDLVDYIAVVADKHRANPAVEFIDREEWDGVDRFRALAKTLDPIDTDLAETLVKRWMIGAVLAAENDRGMSLQGALVLQGAQGAGKTSWFWRLVDGDDTLGKEGVEIDTRDRDSQKLALSHWIVELGELDATIRKSDIAALKSFVTRPRDELRLPYMRSYSKLPRRTTYLATVNDPEFLRDETGNRRYWTIGCGPRLDFRHEVDIAQAWAQAAHLARSGEPPALQGDEKAALERSNEGFSERSPIAERFASVFSWETDMDRESWPYHKTATDALLMIGYDKPNRAQLREAGNALKKLTGTEPRKSHGRKVFDLPPKRALEPEY